MSSSVTDHARAMWRMRLISAFRTALACAIVGGTTLYGPDFLVGQIKFVTFSYFTAVLIASDATLGDTLRGCWHALCATAQVVPLAMLARWFVDPKAVHVLPVAKAALAVAVASFLVALPESTHITAKRIAFGQIVTLIGDAVICSYGTSDGYIWQPIVYVAASTGLGALASVLPMLLPFPDQNYYKVGKLCRIYAENASERMNLYLSAFKSNDNRTKMELLSEAKSVAETGTKLMQSIRILQDGMKWERPWRLFSKLESGLGERMQSMELPMRGIEYSLVSSHAFPVHGLDQEHISNVLENVSIQLQQKIKPARCFFSMNSTNHITSGKAMEPNHFLPIEQTFRPVDKNEWVFFFFSCVDMLLNDYSTNTRGTTKETQTQHGKNDFGIKGTLKRWIQKLTSYARLEFALKCSLSLSLAMLFGLIFDKDNGCWAGLIISTSFVTERQAIFTITNTRAQGTAIGSAYGVICCFLLHYAVLRLLAVLPWIILTSFLRHSQMYGETGGISAAIGALLILGRKKYGPPNEFAIARLTEVFIGLSCYIAVELFLQPTRAATLAKKQLCITLHGIQDCIKVIQMRSYSSKFVELRDKHRNLNSLFSELKKYVTEAEMEPNFLYLPFRTSCYQKLVGSLSNIVDMLYFMTFNLEKVSELPKKITTARNELQEHMNSELDLCQQALSSSLKQLEKENLKKLLEDTQMPEQIDILITEDEEDQRTSDDEDSDEEKKQLRESMVRYLAAVGFCISSLRKEIDETEICIKEIVIRGNHSSK